MEKKYAVVKKCIRRVYVDKDGKKKLTSGQKLSGKVPCYTNKQKIKKHYKKMLAPKKK
jgi:hypothetical protein